MRPRRRTSRSPRRRSSAGSPASPQRWRSCRAKAPRNRSCASAICPRGATRRTIAPLLVMNAVLGGQFVSRINLKLREEKALHLRGADRLRLAARAGAVRRCRRACTPRSTADAIADSLAEIDGIRGVAAADRHGDVAGEGIADARVSAQFRNRAAGGARRSRSSSSTGCRTPTSRSSFRRSTPSPRTRSCASRRRYLDPARATTLVVGDRAAIGAVARSARPRRTCTSTCSRSRPAGRPTDFVSEGNAGQHVARP